VSDVTLICHDRLIDRLKQQLDVFDNKLSKELFSRLSLVITLKLGC
jgi:hypothetical protein